MGQLSAGGAARYRTVGGKRRRAPCRADALLVGATRHMAWMGRAISGPCGNRPSAADGGVPATALTHGVSLFHSPTVCLSSTHPRRACDGAGKVDRAVEGVARPRHVDASRDHRRPLRVQLLLPGEPRPRRGVRPLCQGVQAQPCVLSPGEMRPCARTVGGCQAIRSTCCSLASPMRRHMHIEKALYLASQLGVGTCISRRHYGEWPAREDAMRRREASTFCRLHFSELPLST